MKNLTWGYTSTYLFAEVARLASEAWTADGKEPAAFGYRPSVLKLCGEHASKENDSE